MPIHDDYARTTPFELALPPDRFGSEELGAIRNEVEELGQPSAADELGLFMGLDTVGRILAQLREPEAEAAGEDLQRHGVLLYHAFHFEEAGRPLYLLATPTARYLVEADFGEADSHEDDDESGVSPTEPAPPRPAGYLQLPRHLFWIETEEGGPPEPVDGLFWSAPDGESISILVTAGVRSDRGGFSVLPLPRLPLAHAGRWVSTRIRQDGRDFSSDMPGAELDNLYSIETTGEVLKLVARVYLHLQEVPGASIPAQPADASDDASPPASSLDYHRIALTAAGSGSTAEPEEGG